MALRPVDNQMAVTRTQDVARQQQLKDGEATAVQQAFATQFRQKVEREQTQVQRPPQTESAQIRDDSEGRGGQAGEQASQQQRKKHRSAGAAYMAPGAERREPGKGTRLDVKL